MEGCKVFFAGQNVGELGDSLKINETLLNWPEEAILEATSEKDRSNSKKDMHMVFEYREGDTVLDRFTAPRSNRFYFVHDPNGGKL